MMNWKWYAKMLILSSIAKFSAGRPLLLAYNFSATMAFEHLLLCPHLLRRAAINIPGRLPHRCDSMHRSVWNLTLIGEGAGYVSPDVPNSAKCTASGLTWATWCTNEDEISQRSAHHKDWYSSTYCQIPPELSAFAGHLQGFGGNMQKGKEDRQWPPEMEEPRRSMVQWELEELSLRVQVSRAPVSELFRCSSIGFSSMRNKGHTMRRIRNYDL